MVQVFQKKQFKIYRSDDGYILQNSAMHGFAHTHINNYDTCIYLIKLSLEKRIPHHLPRYLIGSLIRVNDDENYLRHLNDLLENKRKKQEYFNPGRKRAGERRK